MIKETTTKAINKIIINMQNYVKFLTLTQLN